MRYEAFEGQCVHNIFKHSDLSRYSIVCCVRFTSSMNSLNWRSIPFHSMLSLRCYEIYYFFLFVLLSFVNQMAWEEEKKYNVSMTFNQIKWQMLAFKMMRKRMQTPSMQNHTQTSHTKLMSIEHYSLGTNNDSQASNSSDNDKYMFCLHTLLCSIYDFWPKFNRIEYNYNIDDTDKMGRGKKGFHLFCVILQMTDMCTVHH